MIDRKISRKAVLALSRKIALCEEVPQVIACRLNPGVPGPEGRAWTEIVQSYSVASQLLLEWWNSYPVSRLGQVASVSFGYEGIPIVFLSGVSCMPFKGNEKAWDSFARIAAENGESISQEEILKPLFWVGISLDVDWDDCNVLAEKIFEPSFWQPGLEALSMTSPEEFRRLAEVFKVDVTEVKLS